MALITYHLSSAEVKERVGLYHYPTPSLYSLLQGDLYVLITAVSTLYVRPRLTVDSLHLHIQCVSLFVHMILTIQTNYVPIRHSPAGLHITAT